jgi:hypothetical protein
VRHSEDVLRGKQLDSQTHLHEQSFPCVYFIRKITTAEKYDVHQAAPYANLLMMLVAFEYQS